MGKDDTLQNKEVREAVKDYLRELIGARSGAGKGMALTANNLMTVVGRKMTTKSSQGKFVEPPKQPKHHESDNKCHWSVWQHERIPTPTPCRPASGASRSHSAMSARARTTPVVTHPPVALEVDSRTDTPCRQDTPTCYLDDYADDELLDLDCRNTTPNHHSRTPTPNHTRSNSHLGKPPTFASKVNTNTNACQEDPVYMPRLRAWVDKADDYEKNVAYNLMKALECGVSRHTPVERPQKPKCEASRPKSGPPKTRMLGQQRLPRPRTAGIRTCIPEWKAYEAAKRLNNNEDYIPERNIMGNAVRPLTPNNYMNVDSMFMKAHRPYRRDFSINPEWISEDKVRKKVYQHMQDQINKEKEFEKSHKPKCVCRSS